MFLTLHQHCIVLIQIVNFMIFFFIKNVPSQLINVVNIWENTVCFPNFPNLPISGERYTS